MAVASSRKSVSRAGATAIRSTTPAAAKKHPAARTQPPPARAQRPIELYFWPTPNGQKVSIMLEECGLRYDVKPVNIGRGEQFQQDFLKLSPNNRIPAIVDPDGPGGKAISVFESGAILQYLGRKSGKLYPADERGRVEVDQWLFWQMAGLGPMAGQAHHFRQYAPETLPYAIERYTSEVARLYAVMNRRLDGRDFLAGKYSIADIACYTWVMPFQMQGQRLEDYPHLRSWFERIAARPAVQRGLAVGRDLRNAPADLRSSNSAVRRILSGQKTR